jgi:prepilin-type N-terminal cleavage/methylation domain-containing protein
MIASRHNSHPTRAFTLLEVLLALLVFSIVLLAIHSVFFTALRLRDRTDEAVAKILPTEQAVAIIKQDLANLVLPSTNTTVTNLFFGPLMTTPSQISSALAVSGFQGSGMLGDNSGVMNVGQSGPNFYTTGGAIDLTSPFAEIQMVSYFLAQPRDNSALGMDLYRAVTRNLLPAAAQTPTYQFLMSGVQQISFYFYDGNQWQPVWDSTMADPWYMLSNSLPKAIKMELQLAADQRGQSPGAPIQVVVPLLVQQSTNQLETGL